MKENQAPALPKIDFLSAKMQYRIKHAGLRNELLARAIGIPPRDHPKIVDATAGLGRDSFILASLGYEITLLERSEIIHDLLQNALQQAAHTLPEIVDRMTLIHANAIDWLPQLDDDERPDVIYLDPMFPERKKSASVKKDLLIMQDLLGKDSDRAELLEIALACANKKVVVKLPRLAANIGDHAANYSYHGKSSRFDIYLT